ncbi:hypothetical protein [Mycobacterium sp. EPa45]|uniref:hypothetical protein n=1 Tax=Mycobacterium sp. EPa45 TaxID=1545728 RepID=UPI000641AC8F|nr:hypothetical protein [Mycobacterium sp. EPa45]AKK25448.1 hypothetical protein AB431_00505 [Mycobacterium sp. EPa45]
MGSTVAGKLTAAGTPAPIAEKLSPAKELVAKGMASSIPGAPPQLTAAITSSSNEALMAGLQLSMWVGAAAAARRRGVGPARAPRREQIASVGLWRSRWVKFSHKSTVAPVAD